MIFCRPRFCSRLLQSRRNRFRLCSGSSDHITVVAASLPPSLSSFSFSPSSSLRNHHHASPGSSRHFSFINYLVQNQPSNDRKAKYRDDREGRDGNKTQWRGRSTDGRTKRNDNSRCGAEGNIKRRPNPRHHSVRLIGESAARETTELFLEARGSSADGRPAADGADAKRGAPLCRDAAALLAAEQALEFWANRNNGGGRERDDARRRRRDRSPLEEDAGTAYRLFAALHHFHGRHGRVLTNGMYSHVVDALARSPNVDHVRMADALLRQFIWLYLAHNAGGDGERDPSALMRLWELRDPALSDCESRGASKLSPVAPSAPLPIPDDIQWNASDSHHFPNAIRITGVVRGYARSSLPQDAESLLALMISLSCLNGGRHRRMFRPNEVGFATVIDAYSRTHDGPNAERALQMMKGRSFRTGEALDRKALRDEMGLPLVNGANVVAYNAAIGAWARSAKGAPAGDSGGARRPPSSPGRAEVSSSREAADNAERLLREMWSEHEVWRGRRGKNPKNIVLPDVVTYSTVISAYAACLEQPYGVDRARELLAELEGLAVREFDESRHGAKKEEERDMTLVGDGGGRNPNGFMPNTTVYNTLLQAYANAGNATAAGDILRSMISLHSASLEEGGGGPYRHVRPNTRTFNVVLNAWAKGGGGDAGVRANEILDQMKDVSADEEGSARPDVISYNTVLAAWSKSASVGSSDMTEREEGVRASSVVGKSAAYCALRLLDTMERRYMQSDHGDRYGDRRSRVVKPDAVSYSTAIAAFANAAGTCEDGVPMAEEAEAILSRMTDRVGIEPDDYSYNGVLLAWARSSGGLPAARRAESILRSMRDPTVVSWSTVVNSFAHADSANRAEALLREMERNANSYDPGKGGGRAPIAPSVVLYNNVLHAWGKSSDGDASKNAVDLLDRMEGTAKLPRPDAISYQLVLTALQHGKDPNKAERARSVLDRLLASLRGRHDGAEPRQIQKAYNCVLTSCAYTPADAGKLHRSNAARILVETLRDMNLPLSPGIISDGPDQESFALFMQGCIHLFEPASEERNTLITSAFRECCRKGLLNRIIWDKICSALPPELVKPFIEGTIPVGDMGLCYEKLPKKWSCNDR